MSQVSWMLCIIVIFIAFYYSFQIQTWHKLAKSLSAKINDKKKGRIKKWRREHKKTKKERKIERPEGKWNEIHHGN